ncbi:MAG: hypothetical protein ABIJ47_12385 [Candidatus Bathyarchaeota archaeon]
MNAKLDGDKLLRIITLMIQAIEENRRILKDINDSIDTLGKRNTESLEEQYRKLSYLS